MSLWDYEEKTPSYELVAALPALEDRKVPAPDDLPDAQKAIWEKVVAGEPASVFQTEANRQLLRAFVGHVDTRERLQDLIDRTDFENLAKPEFQRTIMSVLNLRERESKMILQIATKLRLTNQSRFTSQTIAAEVRNVPTGPRPWEREVMAPAATVD